MKPNIDQLKLLQNSFNKNGWYAILGLLKQYLKSRLSYKLEPIHILQRFEPLPKTWDSEISKKVKLSFDTLLDSGEEAVKFFADFLNSSWLDLVQLEKVNEIPEFISRKGMFITNSHLSTCLVKKDPPERLVWNDYITSRGLLRSFSREIWCSSHLSSDVLYDFDTSKDCGCFSFDVSIDYLENDEASLKFKYKLVGPTNCQGYLISE